jgi:hypothetical protein
MRIETMKTIAPMTILMLVSVSALAGKGSPSAVPAIDHPGLIALAVIVGIAGARVISKYRK